MAEGREIWCFWRQAARVYEDKWMRCLAYKSTYGPNADFQTCWQYLNTDFYVFYALVRTFKSRCRLQFFPFDNMSYDLYALIIHCACHSK